MRTRSSELPEDRAQAGAQIDILWGIDEIAIAIRQNRSQTFKLLKNGGLPAKQLGKRWCASRKELQRFFGEVAA